MSGDVFAEFRDAFEAGRRLRAWRLGALLAGALALMGWAMAFAGALELRYAEARAGRAEQAALRYAAALYPEAAPARVSCRASDVVARCDVRLRVGVWLALECDAAGCAEIRRHVEP